MSKECTGGYTYHDDRLEYDFDTGALLEIKEHYDRWLTVSPNVFRSWTGERRINGEQYLGPHYYWLTNDHTKEQQSNANQVT